jgi:hypothetical protein
MNVLCRWGWHSWRFVSMGQRREITVPPWTHYVCQLTEECRRCGLRRFSESAPIPKRVKR